MVGPVKRTDTKKKRSTGMSINVCSFTRRETDLP